MRFDKKKKSSMFEDNLHGHMYTRLSRKSIKKTVSLKVTIAWSKLVAVELEGSDCKSCMLT